MGFDSLKKSNAFCYQGLKRTYIKSIQKEWVTRHTKIKRGMKLDIIIREYVRIGYGDVCDISCSEICTLIRKAWRSNTYGLTRLGILRIFKLY